MGHQPSLSKENEVKRLYVLPLSSIALIINQDGKMGRPDRLEDMIHVEAQEIIDDFDGFFTFQQFDMLVVVLRGMPGSGKSTFRAFLAAYARAKGYDVRVCSADDFFDGAHGYRFDPDRLREAHAWCQERFVNAVRDRATVAIIDNTNIRMDEWDVYMQYVFNVNEERTVLQAYRSIQVVKVQFECFTRDMAHKLNARRLHPIDHDVIDRRFQLFEQDSARFDADHVLYPRFLPDAPVVELDFPME